VRAATSIILPAGIAADHTHDCEVAPFTLLQRLTAVCVTQLLSREPSLEELFLAQYGAEPQAARDREVNGHGR
jgi:hypothetical protein